MVSSSAARAPRHFADEARHRRAYDSVDALLADPAVAGRLHQHHQRAAPRPGARGRRGRQARAVRKAAGADAGRRAARWSRACQRGRRRDGDQPSPAQRRHAPQDPRTRPRTARSAGRCSPASSTPSTCRRTCRAGAWTSRSRRRRDPRHHRARRRHACASCSTPSRSRRSACRQSAAHGPRRAGRRRRWPSLRFDNGVLAQLHDAFTVKHAGTGIEIHGDAGLDHRSQRDDAASRSARSSCATPAASAPIAVEHENLYARGVAAFCAAIRGEGEPGRHRRGRRALAGRRPRRRRGLPHRLGPSRIARRFNA